ncbi:MAG: hypothetical protein H7258_11725 [Ferruginibacter sp.]|nr:hypothetical protein [Ferruginibacter sp.]
MKFPCLIFFYCCHVAFAGAQDLGFQAVDSRMLLIPAAMSQSTGNIASFIRSNFKSDKEQVRAAYRWVTYNIKYDLDSMYIFSWGADPAAKVTAAIRRRKGVCENYSALLHDIVKKCGLRSFMISGYTKQSGFIDKVGHSWCAVFVERVWLLCDPTWDAGYETTPEYFLIDPSLFIESHMPFDPIWQLLHPPLTNEAFYKGSTHALNDDYNADKTVTAFLELNEQQRLEAAAARISMAATLNELIKNQLSFIRMKIALIIEDKNMNLYSTVVEEMNKATTALNEFIDYRNRQFIPERPMEEISVLLFRVDEHLLIIQKNLENLSSSTADLQYDAATLEERYKSLQPKLQQQKDFLKRWISASTEERKKIFYE